MSFSEAHVTTILDTKIAFSWNIRESHQHQAWREEYKTVDNVKKLQLEEDNYVIK